MWPQAAKLQLHGVSVTSLTPIPLTTTTSASSAQARLLAAPEGSHAKFSILSEISGGQMKVAQLR